MKKILITLIALSYTLLALEPLKSSTAELLEGKSKRILKKGDIDGDGKIQKEESKQLWRTSARYDKNKDGGLDLEEIMAIPESSVSSTGKKLLNVCYKKTARGGVYLDFYFPDVDTSMEKPIMIFTHGGGWAAGNKSKAGTGSFNEVHRALLKEGFCVVSAGYRLARKGSGAAMRDCVIDVKDALRYISAYKKELGVNPQKVYCFGDSAGGHLAQMILFTPPESLQGDSELANYSFKAVAGVSWYGPCDFQDIQLFNYDGREEFSDRFGARIMGGNVKPEEKEALYREMSPVAYLTKESPPLLMIQGDKDTTIPVKQAYRMKKALETVKAPVEISIVKNAGHNWRSVNAPIQPTKREIVKQTIEFFLKHK